MSVVIHRVVVVPYEVPADQVVHVAICVCIDSVGPSSDSCGGYDIAAIDAIVTVRINCFARTLVSNIVQIPESDQSVCIDIPIHIGFDCCHNASWNLGLVDPYVLI